MTSAWAPLARVLSLRPSRDFSLWWDLLRKGVPFAYAGVVITLFFQVDAVMLEAFRGLHELGIYGAAYKLFEIGVRSAAEDPREQGTGNCHIER